MSVNTAHTENNGVIIHYGELILLFSDDVAIEFPGQSAPLLTGSKQGNIFFTTHRLIFTATNFNDPMKSFSFPFVCLQEIEIGRPLFSANHIRGKVIAQPNGDLFGIVRFKIMFQAGGETPFGQALLHAIGLTRRNSQRPFVPPYTPPTDELLQAPPTLYTSDNNPVWITRAAGTIFRKKPNPGTIYMDNRVPSYPGILPNVVQLNREQLTQSTSQDSSAVRYSQPSLNEINYIPERQQSLGIPSIGWDIGQPQINHLSTAQSSENTRSQSTAIGFNPPQRIYPFSQRPSSQNVVSQNTDGRISSIRPNAPPLEDNSNSNDSPPSYDSLFSSRKSTSNR